MKTKVLIGVGGRFHADRMAAAFSEYGYSVSLYTTLPKSRFPSLRDVTIHSTIIPEIIFRGCSHLGFETEGGLFKMRRFGKSFAMAASVEKNPAVLIGWSSFALEALKARIAPLQIVVRDSAHISEQIKILSEEYALRGHKFPCHRGVEERELEEYERADKILVLSEMAKQSFISRGVPAQKLHVLRLGADLSLFHPSKQTLRKSPLRAVYFGTLSLQKGLPYLLKAVSRFSSEQLTLTCIGSVDKEVAPLLKEVPQVSVLNPMPHSQLSVALREFDVFILPSLHDGFGMVVPQAMASGLATVVSSGAGASELVRNGENGFVIPPCDATAIEAVLRRLSCDRNELQRIQSHAPLQKDLLSWNTYSKHLTEWLSHLLSATSVNKAA